MSIERVIGIDFGTSTSVIKVKTYSDGLPLGAVESADFIRFDNKDTVPTLIYETANGTNSYLIGYEAMNPSVKGKLCQNFKLQLQSEDQEKKKDAENKTLIFFKYLYKAYEAQKKLFPVCDKETTYISYPAKWSPATRELMEKIASMAGFSNVIGIDEPSAAIHTVTVQERGKINVGENGYSNILMVDMGAGTTDLVLCRYAPEEPTPISIINVWPKTGSSCLFGGREIDEKLCDYIKNCLLAHDMPSTFDFVAKNLEKCKAWKENNVSPELEKPNGIVKYCSVVDTYAATMGIDIDFPPLSRDNFEDMLSENLCCFVGMINDCIDDAGIDGNDIDYVILTGGHSRWYFTNGICDGTITRFGRVNLPNIINDRSRVIKLALPQETVALGMVYQRLQTENARKVIYCGECGKPYGASESECPYCAEEKSANTATSATACVSPAPDALAVPTSALTRYPLSEGKSIAGLSDHLTTFLSVDKNMDVQKIPTENGFLVQARARGGAWKQFLGLDKAITVRLDECDNNSVAVEICEGKWFDKAGVMAVSMFVLWPLSITSGIGMIMQGKLPGNIRREISQYIYS